MNDFVQPHTVYQMVYKLTIESSKRTVKTWWIDSFIHFPLIWILYDLMKYLAGRTPREEKVSPIQPNLSEMTTNIVRDSCAMSHVKQSLFSNYFKIIWTPAWIYPIENLLILGDSTYLVKLEDPKVLIASSEST